MEATVARAVPYLVLFGVAAITHSVLYDNASVVASILYWASFVALAAAVHLKFDLIKLDDHYEKGSFREELSDSVWAVRMIGKRSWTVFLTLLVVSAALTFN